jgi:hypothetical protein
MHGGVSIRHDKLSGKAVARLNAIHVGSSHPGLISNSSAHRADYECAIAQTLAAR